MWLLVLLLAAVFLVCEFARLLGSGEVAASLAALVVCYHAGLSMLYYNTAFVYDALCGFFYLAAFVYYALIRAGGRSLSLRQTAIFLGLYLCALNSKEMAVTLPAVLLFWFPAISGWRNGRSRPSLAFISRTRWRATASLTFMMLDADIVAVSPTSVWRVLTLRRPLVEVERQAVEEGHGL